MNTAFIGVLIEHTSLFINNFIAEQLPSAALVYYLVWLAMRWHNDKKIKASFLWHSFGVAATVFVAAIFRIVAIVTFDGHSAYELVASSGSQVFYLLIVPAPVAIGYIAWLKRKVLRNEAR